MSRSSFTIFAQQYFSALLSEFGAVYLDEPVPRDPKLRIYKLPSRRSLGTEILSGLTARNDKVRISPESIGEAELVDVLFEPDCQKSRAVLGVLGELLFAPCIIETFHCLPTNDELRTCLGHWLQWKVESNGSLIPVDETPVEYVEDEDDEYEDDEDEDEDDGEDENEDEKEIVDKLLLIIVPSITVEQSEMWRIQPSSDNISGLYHFPPAFCTTVIATNELPQHVSTLFLRLLGRESTQQSAIQDLMHLEDGYPLRAVALQQLKQWYQRMSQGQMEMESNSLMQLLSQIEI
jgi:hypothetical protein